MKKINFIPFPNLSTAGFTLRQLTPDDQEEIFILRSDEGVLKYLDIPKAITTEDARQFIIKINNGIINKEWIYWAISEKNNSKLIGTICLWNISEPESKADIGFALLPEYQGKGIMQEVIPVIINYGFEKMELHRIDGETSPENIKSIKLMENFGFRYVKNLDKTIIFSVISPR